MNATAPKTPANVKPPDIASGSVPDTLAALRVKPDTGLTHAEVDVRRKEGGYNEVAVQKEHPVRIFLGKFWGMSAWMLELIMLLSAFLHKYSDLAVVSTLLIVNAVLSFVQERRAAGVVETLRRRLQVSARVLRDANWRVVPARELVPGDIVRVRAGDVIPADVKLLDGTLSVDQSALTGESKDVDLAPGQVLSSGSVVRRGEGNGAIAVVPRPEEERARQGEKEREAQTQEQTRRRQALPYRSARVASGEGAIASEAVFARPSCHHLEQQLLSLLKVVAGVQERHDGIGLAEVVVVQLQTQWAARIAALAQLRLRELLAIRWLSRVQFRGQHRVHGDLLPRHLRMRGAQVN